MTSESDRHSNLGYFNWEAARRDPDRVALIDLSVDRPREQSHGELDCRMDLVAAALLDQGLRRGDRLLLAAGNRLEFIEAFFGAMRAGVVPLPLNIKQAPETIEFILRDAGCSAAIVEPACNAHVIGIVAQAGLDVRIAIGDTPARWADYERVLAAADTEALDPPLIAPGQIAFTPYTSGSTGRPKGVLLSHDGMLWGIHTAQRHAPMFVDDRAMVAGPLYHKNAMRVSIKPMLHAGASVVLLPRFEARSFLTALSEYDCTHSGGVPAMYRMLLQEQDLLATLEFPRLKRLAVGSAVVGRDLQDEIARTFAVRVDEAYGLTEGGGPLCPPGDGRAMPPGSCGAAAPEVEVRLFDRNGKDSKSEGELWVRSPAVTLGYINQPELSRERIADGWLKTGDRFVRDADGFFYFQGRLDDRFICGGENIYPKEVELILLGHPQVADAAVLPMPHPVKGEAPAAFVVQVGGSRLGEDELRQYCLDNGPAYAHPRRILFVDDIPLSGTGKVDRKALRRALDGVLSAATPSD